MTMNKHLLTTLPLLAALSAFAPGCSGDDGSSDSGFVSTGGLGDEGGEDGGEPNSGLDPSAGQGGAQDFGLFREILLEGGIPGPETIDDLGFFAEHKIAMPGAECGETVCIHGMLGVMGNMISGSNCTLVMVGMNTPLDPDELERPPLNLAIAVDLSGSMVGQPIADLREGLLAMLGALEPEDRITLVGFSDGAAPIVEQLGAEDPALAEAITNLAPGGGTDIYAGLREAFEQVDEHAEEGRQNRVLLVSDGVATAGLVQDDVIEGLAESWSDVGYGLTTIGIGNDFDVDLMRGLAELGSGSFYYVEDSGALDEVFTEEVQAFVVPLAEDVTISTAIEDGYDLRRGYGTKQLEIWGNDAAIEIPILQIAHRVSASDNDTGRRGGGGAIILELTPTGLDPAAVGTIEFSYRDPNTNVIVEQQIEIESPLAAWETPEDGWFSEGSVEKGFVMLNIYVGFEMAALQASHGDYGAALQILRPLRDSVVGWLDQNEDADIEDDLIYVDLFIQNLEAQGGGSNTPNPVPPPEPWPSD